METLKSQRLSTATYLAAESRLTTEEKAALAGHLAAGLGAAGGEEFVEAEAVLRLMTWNAEPRVVEAMAKAAAANPNTPHSVAWALANDDEAAAALVLESCAAFSDEDLVSLIEFSGNTAKMSAMARRSDVSENVSRSLVNHGDEDTVHILLANAKALISDDAYGAALDRFGQSARIQEGIVDRPVISAALALRLSASLSEELKRKLVAKSAGLMPAPALPGYSEERSEAEWETHFALLMRDRSLNATELLRNLCLGYFDSAARGLAALSNAPYAEVCNAMLQTPPALAPYWQKAELAKDWLPVIEAAVTAVIQVDRSGGKSARDLFSRNIIHGTQANLRAAKIALTDAQKRFFARPGGIR